jgi:hypothetical protein
MRAIFLIIALALAGCGDEHKSKPQGCHDCKCDECSCDLNGKCECADCDCKHDHPKDSGGSGDEHGGHGGGGCEGGSCGPK